MLSLIFILLHRLKFIKYSLLFAYMIFFFFLVFFVRLKVNFKDILCALSRMQQCLWFSLCISHPMVTFFLEPYLLPWSQYPGVFCWLPYFAKPDSLSLMILKFSSWGAGLVFRCWPWETMAWTSEGGREQKKEEEKSFHLYLLYVNGLNPYLSFLLINLINLPWLT